MSEKKDENTIKETARDQLYTYGDYLNWSDEKRYEIIDGQVYLMSVAPVRRHQKYLLNYYANLLIIYLIKSVKFMMPLLISDYLREKKEMMKFNSCST